MAKFDSTMYAALWSREGRQIQSLILEDPNRIRQFYTFWRQKFAIDPQVIQQAADGTATFISKMRQIEPGTLMDMRAPLGDGTPMEVGNAAEYTGVIPDFIAKTYLEKAQEREYREQLFEQVGEDNAALAAYTIDFLQTAVNSANMTLSHMSAQLLSKGYIQYKAGEGVKAGLYKADIPTENKLNGGAYVWSDTTNFKFLDWCVAMVDKLNTKLGADLRWQLEIPKDVWRNYVLKNAQVISQVRWVYNVNGTSLPETAHITEEMAMAGIRAWANGDMPEIVIVEEKQIDKANPNSETGSVVVNGWASGIVVMRPVGLAGYIRHTTNLDSRLSKYQNNLISTVYTTTLGGLLTIENSVVPNGIYKEWQARAMMQAIPSLDEFLYHYIIDTAQVNGTAAGTVDITSTPLS